MSDIPRHVRRSILIGTRNQLTLLTQQISVLLLTPDLHHETYLMNEGVIDEIRSMIKDVDKRIDELDKENPID